MGVTCNSSLHPAVSDVQRKKTSRPQSAVLRCSFEVGKRRPGEQASDNLETYASLMTGKQPDKPILESVAEYAELAVRGQRKPRPQSSCDSWDAKKIEKEHKKTMQRAVDEALSQIKVVRPNASIRGQLSNRSGSSFNIINHRQLGEPEPMFRTANQFARRTGSQISSQV